MIDIENKVLNTVFAEVRNQFADAACYGEYVAVPASFPCVCLYEQSNTTYKPSRDNALQDHQSNLMYSCNVYSDKTTGKKAEARAIAKIVDDAMQSMKFTRTFFEPLPNLDRTIYRITMRYESVAGEPIITDNNTITYQMYRK